MFLTQMHLNPARRGTRHLLASPQRMHAAVMLAFPPGTEVTSEEGRVLWRVDRDRTNHTLYISSPQEPDLTHLVEQAGWPASPTTGWRTTSTDAFRERLTKGQDWVFRLTANPVHSRRPADGGRGKIYGHVTAEQQEQWFQSRSETWGFEITSCAIRDRRRVTFARHSDGSSRPVTLSMVTFDGTLRVAEPDTLRAALVVGVGRAKGYGCGLITLAPAR